MHDDQLPDMEFSTLGIQADQLRRVETIYRGGAHKVIRLQTGSASYILKWFSSPLPVEIQVYGLLERLGVPVLPVYALTERALLLEDLEYSQTWRLASEEDTAHAETGRAVAEWYRRLHAEGTEFLASPDEKPVYLLPWIEEISLLVLEKAAVKLDLANAPGWSVLLEMVEPLKQSYRTLPQTFNYNDFYWVNLALSRSRDPLRAVVFDYDCFRTGAVCSDWRNVVYSLSGEGRAAFIEAYGPVSETERALDEPLSELYGLVIASRRETVPGWARPILEGIRSGELYQKARAALIS
jgi:hypothetical protein